MPVCKTTASLAVRAARHCRWNAPPFRAFQTDRCDECGVAAGIIAVFPRAVDAPTRPALKSWFQADLARLPPPADPNSAAARLSGWKLIGALADVAGAAGDVDGFCGSAAACRAAMAMLRHLRSCAWLAEQVRNCAGSTAVKPVSEAGSTAVAGHDHPITAEVPL